MEYVSVSDLRPGDEVILLGDRKTVRRVEGTEVVLNDASTVVGGRSFWRVTVSDGGAT